ncbi:unnamed protein product [Cuscuta campestris]|uniref:Uncharacterized protein n=1 Tax=Cuscuta campestris TaxID=132261 RepID=A0A484K808_9ASTE|nr:unnamed protein product [Cuscuta campestris]
MKVLLIFVLSLLSLLVSPPLIPAAAAASPAVLDVKGKPLIVGSNYFVLPVIHGSGGGLYPSNTKPNTFGCPLDIIQEANEVQKGIPVVFSPVNATAAGGGGTVPLSTDLNVRFYTPTICARRMGWKTDGPDESSKQYFVKTGGAEGNPGPQTLSSWFKIEKAGSDFKFVFCPTVCSVCKVVCKDVGIYVQKNGARFLVLSEVPFKVMFEKTF